MSEIVASAVEKLRERLDGRSMPGTVKFVILDEGSVLIDEQEVRADDGPADCVMTANAETFQGILDGDVNPTSAFMTGRLKIEGDMGLAMKLGTLLS
jgi:putative sterol carrier protein